MYDQETFEDARARDGDAAEDRDDSVDELLEWEQLGRNVGDPLAADDYSRYPSQREELSGPKWRELLRDLFAHPLVRGYGDAVEELGGNGDTHMRRKWSKTLQNAADAASLDAGELFDRGDPNDVGGPQNALTALTSDLSRHVVREDNPLCLAYLYVEQGLSAEEIATVFETDESAVRRTLHRVGLVVRKEDRPDGRTMSDLLVNAPTGDGEDESEDGDADGKISVNTSDF
jgi:hypothetical protein